MTESSTEYSRFSDEKEKKEPKIPQTKQYGNEEEKKEPKIPQIKQYDKNKFEAHLRKPLLSTDELVESSATSTAKKPDTVKPDTASEEGNEYYHLLADEEQQFVAASSATTGDVTASEPSYQTMKK